MRKLKSVLELSEKRIRHFHENKSKSPKRKPSNPYTKFKEIE